jgi:hypothetical protein
LIKCAKDHALDNEVQAVALIGIDDARRVAAEFQHHLLLASARFQVPAHGRRAGERQQLEAFVGGEQIRAVAMRGQDRERADRQIGFRQHLADDQRSDRRTAGGLEHERTTRRDRRRDFMRRQIERKIEW